MKYISKENLSKATGLLGNRFFLLAVIVVLIMLSLKQCGDADHAKAEALREHNNYLASLDSVRVIKNDLGHLIVEKSAYQLKVSELSKDQKELIARLDLKSNGRGNTPRTVIQTVSEYRDSIVNIASEVVKDPNGNESITFLHEPQLPGKNKLKISGKVPYDLSLSKDLRDTTKYVASVIPGGTTLTIEQNIDIVTALYQDPKSKRIMTRVSTTYPNLTFSDVNSFDITDNPETRKALKAARKEFGLGVNVGYGLLGTSTSLTPGFYIGLGVHYSPKFLQFGK
jgi:hypothetical protein